MTRIVRKTTTLTRGEENRVAEDLTKQGYQKSLRYTSTSSGHQTPTKTAKTVRVRSFKRNAKKIG